MAALTVNEPGKSSLMKKLYELVSVTIAWKPVNGARTYIRLCFHVKTINNFNLSD